MKNSIYIFSAVVALGAAHASVAHGACSVADLTRCLDSVCAINVSSNPAARCQYCGTTDAGTPTNTMRSVSVGASAKYNLSAKELQNAPDAPSARYAWAIRQCIARVDGCTAENASDAYDSLIEQSCRAAGISAEMSALAIAAAKPASQSKCTTDITACMTEGKHCGANYAQCTDNADFDAAFATCSVLSTGCDEYTANIRSTMITTRDRFLANAENTINGIVESYQNARAQKLATARAKCTNNVGRDACINSVCDSNMPNKCAGGDASSEKSIAANLCKFYELACNVLK